MEEKAKSGTVSDLVRLICFGVGRTEPRNVRGIFKGEYFEGGDEDIFYIKQKIKKEGDYSIDANINIPIYFLDRYYHCSGDYHSGYFITCPSIDRTQDIETHYGWERERQGGSSGIFWEHLEKHIEKCIEARKKLDPSSRGYSNQNLVKWIEIVE